MITEYNWQRIAAGIEYLSDLAEEHTRLARTFVKGLFAVTLVLRVGKWFEVTKGKVVSPVDGIGWAMVVDVFNGHLFIVVASLEMIWKGYLLESCGW